MVRVPEYTSDVALRPAYRQGVDVDVSPSAFGSELGRGLQQLGRGLGDAADAMARVQDIEDTTRAKDADNAYATWVRNRMYGDGGFMTLEGKAAVDGRSAFEREAEERRREFGKGLTPGAAESYQRASQARLQSTLQQSAIHAAQGRKTWFTDASNARVETFANDALVGFTDPATVRKSIAAGQAEIRQQGAMRGWDADTLKAREADFISGVHKNITLRIAQDDPLAAEAYMKANAGQMTGAAQYELNKALGNEIKSEKSKREADAIFQRGRKPSPAASAGRRTVADTGPTQARAFLTGRLAKGLGKEDVDGLDPSFAANLSAMLQDAPPDIRDGLGILSGYRSPERQDALWRDALKKYGTAEAARKWVAPPGASQHNHGQAVDIAYNGRSLAHAPKNVVDWVHASAAKYGLRLPMAHEPWHVEAETARSGTVAPRGNMVSVRAGMPSFTDIEDQLSKIADPDVRDLTRRRVYAQMEAASKAEVEREKAAKAELWRYIDQGATPDQVPMEIRQMAGMGAVASAWGYIETANKGRAVDSDETLLYDMRRYAAADPSKFADVDLNEYRDRLSKEAIKELTGLQTTALTDQRKAREDGLNLTTAFAQASGQLEALGISATGKKGAQREEVARRIAMFQNALASEMDGFKRQNDGKAPTQLDVQGMINRLLLPITVKQPGYLWGMFGDSVDKSRRLFEAGARPDASTVEVAVEYKDIPIDVRRRISIELEKKLERKPSEEEIVQRYEEFALNR